MRRLIQISFTIALIAGLAACSGDGATSGDTSAAGAVGASTAATEPAADPTTADLPTTGSDHQKFGDTVAFDDGLEVTISTPEAFTPSESAAGAESGDPCVVFTVTVKNGSGADFDPVMFVMSAQSGSAEASAVFDSEQGIEGPPTTPVLDGRDVSWKQAFSVADPGDIVLQIAPDFEHDPVIFTS